MNKKILKGQKMYSHIFPFRNVCNLARDLIEDNFNNTTKHIILRN